MAGSLHVSYGSSASILRRPRVVRSTPNIHREADITDRQLGARTRPPVTAMTVQRVGPRYPCRLDRQERASARRAIHPCRRSV